MPTAPALFAYHRLVIGYHGCDKSVVESVILRDQPLAPSRNRYDWLGEGIYFWENGPARAMAFAKWKEEREEIALAAVLGAYLHLGRCFDLTDTWATDQLGHHYQALTTLVTKAGETMPQNRKGFAGDADLVLRDLDCLMINTCLTDLDDQHPTSPIQTVRGVFIEGRAPYPGAGFRTKTHVQIAVRDPACILGFFKPSAV